MSSGTISTKKIFTVNPAILPTSTSSSPSLSPQQITEVIDEAVTDICSRRFTDTTAWTYTKYKFRGWTALQFNSALSESINLRNTLRRHGVFVNIKNADVGGSLVNMLREIKEHEWTLDEVERAEEEVGPLRTWKRYIQAMAGHLIDPDYLRPEFVCDSPFLRTPSSSCASTLSPTPSTSSTTLSPQAMEQITKVIDSAITTINKGLTDKKAWTFARTTFKDWSALQFNRVHGESNILRDTLRRHGVFVDTEGDDVGDSLVAMLNETEEHKWTLDEIERAEEEVGPMRTWKRYIHAMAPNLIDPSYCRHPPAMSPPSPMAGTGQWNEMESQHARNHDCANSDAELWEYVDGFQEHQQTDQAQRTFVIKRGKERSPLGRLLRDKPIPEAFVNDYQFDADQHTLLMELWQAYPKERRYSGRFDSPSLMMLFKEFLVSFERYGLYEEYLQYALPIMMADGARWHCVELLPKAMHRDWETVILLMLNEFEGRYTRRERVLGWFMYTFDDYITEHGAGKSPSEQAYDYYVVLRTRQYALDSNRDEKSLFNRLATGYLRHHTTIRSATGHMYSDKTAQKLAAAVREELAGQARARALRKKMGVSSSYE